MSDWDPAFYKRGYEGYEAEENFPTTQSLTAYRRLLLDKTALQVEAIRRHLGNRKLRVLEFASGNGRLLVALALAGLLEHGVGVEISQSRSRFAAAWASDLGLQQLETVAADALAWTDFQPGTFDLCVCLTAAFNYLYAIDTRAPANLIHKTSDALAPGGQVLLELYRLTAKRRQMLALADGRLRLWEPLPPEDRFAYYLDDFTYWPEKCILKHEKVFMGRGGEIDEGRVEVLRYYTPEDIRSLLGASRFQDVAMYGNFLDASTDEDLDAAQVIWARKPK